MGQTTQPIMSKHWRKWWS